MASVTQTRTKRAATPEAGKTPARRRLPLLLRRAWFNLNQTFRRRIAHTGITPDQFTVMRSILEGDSQGMTQRDLTELMSSDPNTIASLLERMESAGLVKREPHEKDRRANRIRLKPPGRKKFGQARDIALELQREVLAALPPEKHDEFLLHLELVANACKSAAEKDRE